MIASGEDVSRQHEERKHVRMDVELMSSYVFRGAST